MLPLSLPQNKPRLKEKRKKGVSTNTSGMDLDSSDTAVNRQDGDMEVSGAILGRLKAIEEKLEDNKNVLSAKIEEEIEKTAVGNI